MLSTVGASSLALLTNCASLGRTMNGMVPQDRFHRSTTQYKNPTSPHEYNTNNPQNFEPGGRWLKTLRAEFNRTGDLDLLNPLLPYRSRLKKEAQHSLEAQKKLNEHDQHIDAFVRSKHVQFWFADEDLQLYPLDNSDRYIIAARIIDLMHNRMDLVWRVIHQDKPFRIVMFKDLKQDILFDKNRPIGGYFSFGNGDLELDQFNFWHNILDVSDGDALNIHEFTHAVDSTLILGLNIPNGLLPGMPKSHKDQFVSERNRLFHLYRQNKKAGKEGIPGIDSYAFNNRLEFLPTMVEHFYETPETLKKVSPRLYEIFKQYYKLDPANGYQDLE